MANVLKVEGLCKQYGMSPRIINNFSFSFEAGTVTGLLGKNGSGKSTLLKMMALLSKPDEGKIVFNGHSVWEKPDLFLSELGIVSDWLSLPETLSFDELLTWQLEKKGFSEEAKQKEINELKSAFDFDERSAQPIRTYSSGMRKKTAICAALCGNPSVLILDEPFQALDEETRARLTRRILVEKEKNTIILLATHLDHSEAELITTELKFPL